jgi:hypothetical protein
MPIGASTSAVSSRVYLIEDEAGGERRAASRRFLFPLAARCSLLA